MILLKVKSDRVTLLAFVQGLLFHSVEKPKPLQGPTKPYKGPPESLPCSDYWAPVLRCTSTDPAVLT